MRTKCIVIKGLTPKLIFGYENRKASQKFVLKLQEIARNHKKSQEIARNCKKSQEIAKKCS
jgi:hypothetical protein